MPNWEIIEKLWNQIFGAQITFWLLVIIGTIFTIWLILLFVSQIIQFWKSTIWPIFYDEDEKQRNFKRRLFAEQLEYEINKINRDEREWEDYRFVELEAEIEAEGLHSRSSVIPFLRREYRGLVREKSLSNALKTSKESIILLEGEPGSGKSVALRHVTLDLIRKAKVSRNNKTTLPIYINLRGLRRLHKQVIDRQLILNYIFSLLNRVHMRDLEVFLEKEFEKGLNEGTWLFLFDSFDEIPEILSANEANTIVRNYADAISDFLHSMNRCRGIVASRYFRGPGHVDWARFNITNLTLERQVQLIRQARIPRNDEQFLIAQITAARPELQVMLVNPLFLSMVIEQTLASKDFPENTFSVFETYISQRFERDRERLRKRFGLESEKVMYVAELVAFCMTSDTNIGLSPDRNVVKESFNRLQFERIHDLDKYFDALEFIKIGRSEIVSGISGNKTFAFSHRRFQEYFATRFVMKTSSRVSSLQLLTDARWRETTVVLCQTQSEEMLHDLMSKAGDRLYNFALEIESWRKTLEEEGASFPAPILWPPGLLHLLSLLQDGFSNRKYILPEYMENNATVILEIAQSYGIFPDRKWSLEVSGIAEQTTLLDALRTAIKDSSYLLNQVAYEQVSKLESIPEDVSRWIRKSLIEKASSHQLSKQRYTTQAFLSRLSNKEEYLRLLRYLLTVPTIDLILHLSFGFILFLLTKNGLHLQSNAPSIAVFMVSILIFFAMPYISYFFTYVIPDDETTIIGMQPYAFSYLIRLFTITMAMGFAVNNSVKLLIGILSYLILIPISVIILIKDGFIWKNDLQILASPIQVLIYGIKQRNIKYASSNLIISALGIIGIAVVFTLFDSIEILNVIFTNITWVLILECFMLLGIGLAVRENFQRKKTEKMILKADQEKLQAWEEKQKHDSSEFLELFKELKTPECMLQIITNISNNDILEKTEISIWAIKSAIQHVESSKATKKLVPVIDELCILLERIESGKKVE